MNAQEADKVAGIINSKGLVSMATPTEARIGNTISVVATLQEANVLTYVDTTIEVVIEDADPMSVFGKDWGVRTGGPGQYTGRDGGTQSGTSQQYQNKQGPRFSGGGGTFEGT